MNGVTEGAAYPDLGKAGEGIGTAFGTFGELLQGMLYENGLDFLVTLPIAQFSTAYFQILPDDDEVRVLPASKKKSRLLAATILRAHRPACGGVLRLSSTLPVGKGFASSSADLVATARAVGKALGTEMDEFTVEGFLRDIEPSDGVMHPGIVVYYHREVRLREALGFLPPLVIVGCDEGGMVDTVAFNQRPKPFTEADKREYEELLGTLTEAVRRADLHTVGNVATRSAEKNAKLQPRRYLPQLRRICDEIGGLGVVAAHSGTMLGILLADGPDAAAGAVHQAYTRCGALPGVRSVSVHHSLTRDHTVPEAIILSA